ncbi:MAG: metallophosphoesterase family protein [Deltaproteobacteria bacterium]|nr:metallophosphoesterase family protein [Deltaproteobacteria bacterium]
MRMFLFSASSILALVSGCAINSLGNLASSKTGDTSHLVTRSSPLKPLRQACGANGAMRPEASMIARKPYLQQVTTSSATFGWVTSAPGGQSVVITKPETTDVIARADATRDNATDRVAGHTQMWTTTDPLEPDTVYCYQVMVNGVAVSEKIGFRTAPTADSTRTIGILAFGDSGSGNSDQWALREQMEEVPYQLMIHTGDLAYEDGSMENLEQNVFNVYDDLFRHIPFYPAAGNHDHHSSSAAPFREVFKLPENGDGEKWYSYDWGRIHFVALDTEADYKTQAKWLDEDLSKSNLPWKVVYLHRPPYSSGAHGSDTGLRTILEPVINKHRVQLVLSGHDHNYERMKPHAKSGTQYIVTGGGGRGTYAVGTSSFTAFSSEVIHYVYIESDVDKMTLHAIDGEGREFDSVVIPR